MMFTVWLMVAWLDSSIAGIPVPLGTHQTKERCEAAGKVLSRANTNFKFVCIENDVLQLRKE